MRKKYQKKGIGPIVATALLLVVAVVSLVTFQTWFQSYSSGIYSSVETMDISAGVNVETIKGDMLYVRSNKDNLYISKIKIGDVDCNLNKTLIEGMNPINVSDCLTNVTTSTPNIVLIGEKGIVDKTIYLPKINLPTVESILSSSLLCTTDIDGDGQILSSCANYPMTNTTYEGDLDVNDANSSIKVDMSCIYNNDKSGCLSNYVIDGCGSETVLDIGTGFCWDRNFNRNGTKTWDNAKTYCNDLATHPSGHTDWYLPSRQEFETIVDLTRIAPHIAGGNTIFNSVVSNYYWTKTTYGPITTGAFGVSLDSGGSYGHDKASFYYVACVRRS